VIVSKYAPLDLESVFAEVTRVREDEVAVQIWSQKGSLTLCRTAAGGRDESYEQEMKKENVIDDFMTWKHHLQLREKQPPSRKFTHARPQFKGHYFYFSVPCSRRSSVLCSALLTTEQK
jgi:hypothetical protein